MHKCFKCGTEFEGGFCPECGTQWQEEKHCPNCGATLAGSAKFCNNCGYSFVGSAEEKKPEKEKKPSKVGAFFQKAWAWIKRHAKIVIPTACAAVVLVVILSLIPTFILMSVNGTYYAYSFDENGEIVFNEKTYITLSTGKWTDEEGKEGSYSLSGGEITFTYIDEDMKDLGDLFGEDVGPEEMKGTVENGLLTINENGFNRLFLSKGHNHAYGEWEKTKEPTCTEEGEQRHTCACRKVDSEKIAPTGHRFDRNHTCERCGEKTDHIFNENNECILCGNVIIDGWEFQYGSFFLHEVGGVDGPVIDDPENILDGYVVVRIGTVSGDIIIPQSFNGKRVFALGENAFKDCTSLTSITIPDCIVEIRHGAFEGCSSLASITLPNHITYIGEQAFKGCSSLTSITIPDSVKEIGRDAFSECSLLESIQLSNKIIYIRGDAFSGCSSLKNIIIPNSVIGIRGNAFKGCSSLQSITIPDNLVDISDFDSMFEGCSSLTSITVSSGNLVFHSNENCLIETETKTLILGCKNSVIPADGSVTSIGDFAFGGCSGLTSVTIPDSVTWIGEYAFYGCTSLTSIKFEGTKAQWKEIYMFFHDNIEDPDTGSFTVQCTDGKLDKNGNEIE